MNRIDRLFAILLLLQQKHRIRGEDLAKRFNVSARTIYRDMQALSEIGVPLVPLPGEGYELPDDFRLLPVMLDHNEATAIFLAARLLIHSSEGRILLHAETALEKISGGLPPHLRDHLQTMSRMIAFFPAQQRLNWDAPHLGEILSAIEQKHSIRIRYRAYQATQDGESRVDSYHITYAEGAWYVYGYCHLVHDMRSFRLNRIKKLDILDTTFEERSILKENKPVILVRVRFADHILGHVLESPRYALVRQESWGVMRFEVHKLEEIRNWLFGFGANAEVLEPQELRDWMKNEAQRLIKQLT